jgi:hypothetical protein
LKEKRKLPISVSSIFLLRNSGNMETWRHGDGDMERWRHRHVDMKTWRSGDMETWRHGDRNMEFWCIIQKGKWKKEVGPRRFFLTRLLFVHHAIGSLIFVRLLMKKQTEVIHLQMG